MYDIKTKYGGRYGQTMYEMAIKQNDIRNSATKKQKRHIHKIVQSGYIADATA